MKVTREQVEQMAALARLRLSEVEMDRLAAELGNILDHAAELGEATTAGTPDDDTVQAPLRADEPVTDPLNVPPAHIAPDWKEGFFTVPRLEAMKPGSADEED